MQNPGSFVRRRVALALALVAGLAAFGAQAQEWPSKPVRIAGELGREVATGKEARDIYKIGQSYDSVDETLARLGYAPNRKPGQTGFTFHA